MTKVFISWSGELSKQFAEALRGWLPSVLQHVEPYFSPDDIEKGTKWDKEISEKLEETQVGIICLTRENVERPWILFEAGALSKNVDQSNVCPIVLGLGKTDIKGPLARFQATELNKKDFKRLIETVNKASGDRELDPGVLDNVFDKWWPEFEEKAEQILSSTDPDQETDEPIRKDRELLEEILSICRENNRIQSNKGSLWSYWKSKHDTDQDSDFNDVFNEYLMGKLDSSWRKKVTVKDDEPYYIISMPSKLLEKKKPPKKPEQDPESPEDE